MPSEKNRTVSDPAKTLRRVHHFRVKGQGAGSGLFNGDAATLGAGFIFQVIQSGRPLDFQVLEFTWRASPAAAYALDSVHVIVTPLAHSAQVNLSL